MEYKTANDKILWERCRNGDQGAFAELFGRHFKQMLRISFRYIKDSMTAEELVMDAFISLWAKREQINITGDFSNYLFVALHNIVISHARKNLPTCIALEQVTNQHPSEYAADLKLRSDELKHLYYAAIERLSPRRRQVFLMRRNEDLSYAEIAQKMNISISAVDNHMTAALEFLRVNTKGVLSLITVLFISFLA